MPGVPKHYDGQEKVSPSPPKTSPASDRDKDRELKKKILHAARRISCISPHLMMTEM